jgi:hypothetical protein
MEMTKGNNTFWWAMVGVLLGFGFGLLGVAIAVAGYYGHKWFTKKGDAPRQTFDAHGDPVDSGEKL